jgi:DNA-directed RNA polymerase specialized sigma24 family protein
MTNTDLQHSELEFLAHFPDEYPRGFPEEFNLRFVRCLRLLHFIAGRVCGADGVEEAVRNCFVSASREFRSFESEVAFRAWLVRVQIDEALLVGARVRG